MTRGAEPQFAETAYAQWIKSELATRGWQKKDLAAQLLANSGGRLGKAGADQLVRRATYGHDISVANRALISLVLGPAPIEVGDPLAELLVVARRLEAAARRIEQRADDLAAR